MIGEGKKEGRAAYIANSWLPIAEPAKLTHRKYGTATWYLNNLVWKYMYRVTWENSDENTRFIKFNRIWKVKNKTRDCWVHFMCKDNMYAVK